jgi:hypothetical protein
MKMLNPHERLLRGVAIAEKCDGRVLVHGKLERSTAVSETQMRVRSIAARYTARLSPVCSIQVRLAIHEQPHAIKVAIARGEVQRRVFATGVGSGCTISYNNGKGRSHPNDLASRWRHALCFSSSSQAAAWPCSHV